jgi:hypothetical protein|uniref:hypothetical protein n=1 Tax=Algoriphagus sp. TaxID=1872435 RepID=UPI00258FB7B8|nr:hypothetical protein [Algoriphagus sp.]
MKNLHLIFIFAMLSSLVSCKAYRNVENLEPKSSKEVKSGPFDRSSLTKLVPGDKIKIVTVSGFTYSMTFMNWTGEHVRGTVRKVNSERVLMGEVKDIPINEIEDLYVRRVSAAASLPLVLVSGLGVVVGIIAIVWANGGGMAW